MVQSAAEVAAMLGLAEDDPVVVEALEAQAIADKEERARLRVARTREYGPRAGLLRNEICSAYD